MQREKRNGVWRMLLCGSKRRKMSQSMIATSLLCVLISVAIAVCAIGYFTFQLVVGEKGKARVDVLQQISDSNSVNRTNMVKAMDALYEDFYDDLTAPKSEKSSSAIQMLLEQTNRQFKRIGMDMTIDILMNDRRMFSTDPDENNLKSLKNTYWYIKHYSGETDTSWNLRFWDVDDISTYGLAYGKTVYAQDGKVVGTIVLTSRYEALFRTFQKLVSDGVKVYILDRNAQPLQMQVLSREVPQAADTMIDQLMRQIGRMGARNRQDGNIRLAPVDKFKQRAAAAHLMPAKFFSH